MSIQQAVVVTGGSNGLGLRLLCRLLKHGYHVFSIGQTYPVVPEKFARRITHLACNLGVNGYSRAVTRWLDGYSDQFDFVGFIHSAGVGNTKPLLESSVESIVEQININLQSSILLTKIVLPHLNRHQSRIFFIGSRSRRFPFLGGSAYCASKAGLYALSDCLALEVRKLGWNIGITIFEFGTIATGFASVPVSDLQISPDGAARLMMRIFVTPLNDYDVRVVEAVPAVSRLSNG